MVRERDLEIPRANKALEMTQAERDRQTSVRGQQIVELRELVRAEREAASRRHEGIERELEKVKRQPVQ
eukprot:11176104-Lingulodinium_polyedra.AAC.1